MQEAELLAIIEQEARQAIGADDITALERAKMLSAYMGEAKNELAPPEIEGRSRVVSKDLMDTVEWAMPSLMRMFAGSDDVIKFEPETEKDEQAVKDATDYVSYLFWRKNPGFRTLHDAIKNALIQRQAVVKVYCDETWDEREEHYEGLTDLDIQALQGDPAVEIVAQAEMGMASDPANPQPQPLYAVTARRRESRKQERVVGVPPEEIRFNKSARTIEEARFVQHRTMKTVSDLRSLGYDEDKIQRLPTENSDKQWDRQQTERGQYDNTLSDAAQARLDDALREIELCTTHLKVDYDGDGVAEFRRVVHAGGVIFENEVTDDHDYALFCPILMPFKAVGLGLWDLCEDLQRIRTVLTRQLLDNAYLANNPRTAVVNGKVNLDDLLNPRVGGIVRMDTLDAMRTEDVPFIGGQALNLLDHFGQVRDKRTGVTEFNQGLGADSLSKTEIGSEGAQAMMDSAMQRIELIARVLAETGVARVWQLLLKKATQYADREQEAKVNGRWLRVNPREWKDRYVTVVNVGLGTANKRQQVQNLTLIGQAQREAAQIGLCGPQQIYATLTKLCEAMGYRESDQFFLAPESNEMPQTPDPNEGQAQLEQIKGEVQAHVAQVKAQADIEVERMRQQFQAQEAAQQQQLEAERDRQKMANDMALEQFKTQQQAELERYKADLQHVTTIEVARINAEAKIASAKTMGAKDSSTANADVQYQETHEQ
jgi:hypothetical protein